MTFSTKYLAEAIALLGIAWAVIRWIASSLRDISGGSRDAEGHRFLESMWRSLRGRAREETVYERGESREAEASSREHSKDLDHRQALDDTYRELRADGPLAERATSMSERERQAIYDDLVRRLDADGVPETERAFALSVAMQRLALKGGEAQKL